VSCAGVARQEPQNLLVRRLRAARDPQLGHAVPECEPRVGILGFESKPGFVEMRGIGELPGTIEEVAEIQIGRDAVRITLGRLGEATQSLLKVAICLERTTPIHQMDSLQILFQCQFAKGVE